jgi:hypothetical protein
MLQVVSLGCQSSRKNPWNFVIHVKVMKFLVLYRYLFQVLSSETGIPITLSIVYSAIARRLGVICEPVNAPSHFLLRWKQDPS